MSNYNEYLHGDFKHLGFSNYIKMLDSELRLKDVSFLFTRQNLTGAPFFGRYNTEIRFAVVHPSEESGKRSYIGLIQSSLFDSGIEHRQEALIHNHLYYKPIPTQQAIIDHTIQLLEDHLRRKLSTVNRIAIGTPVEDLSILASHVRTR